MGLSQPFEEEGNSNFYNNFERNETALCEEMQPENKNDASPLEDQNGCEYWPPTQTSDMHKITSEQKLERNGTYALEPIIDPEVSKEEPIEWGVEVVKNEIPQQEAQEDRARELDNKSTRATTVFNISGTVVDQQKQPKQLKICSWNVAECWSAALKKGLLDYLNTEYANIIALQETKCPPKRRPNNILLDGYHTYFEDGVKPGYSGVATLTKAKPLNVIRGIGDNDCDPEGRALTLEFVDYYVVNVYVPNSGEKLVTLKKRLAWNSKFKEFLVRLDQKKTVICCGDMNVAHNEIDLATPQASKDKAGFTPEERNDLGELLLSGFVDCFRYLHPNTRNAYTFWQYGKGHKERNMGWRINYFIAFQRLQDHVHKVEHRTDIGGSDHCPIVMESSLDNYLESRKKENVTPVPTCNTEIPQESEKG